MSDSAVAIHRIRLRGPWQQAAAPVGAAPVGAATPFTRRFGCPTGLDGGQRVYLVIDVLTVATCVWLNSQLLADVPAGISTWRYDITDRLTASNLLELHLAATPADSPPGPLPRAGERSTDWSGGRIGEVRLEICQPGREALPPAPSP
ncbi:MAG: hypothetical protein U0935_13615 [Pirellulales bacterium]